MNKSEFLNTIERCLGSLRYEEKKDILYDYEEHFRIGNENGKTEEEIAQALGDPRSIAKNYAANYTLEKAKSDPSSRNILEALFAGLSLGFLNLIIVLPIFISFVAVVFSLFAAAFAIIISGVAVFISSFLPINDLLSVISMPYDLYINPAVTLLTGVGLSAFGVLFGIGDCYLAKYFYKATVLYLNWTLNVIKK